MGGPKLTAIAFTAFMASVAISSALTVCNAAGVRTPVLRIIKDALYERDNFYFVKGAVYNPSERAVKNVSIRYYIWKKFQATNDNGTIIRDTGGLVEATIKYIPPKGSVDFEAVSRNAPVMTPESGLKPDPIAAEISASWDE